jgi:hypothetical protein
MYGEMSSIAAPGATPTGEKYLPFHQRAFLRAGKFFLPDRVRIAWNA